MPSDPHVTIQAKKQTSARTPLTVCPKQEALISEERHQHRASAWRLRKNGQAVDVLFPKRVAAEGGDSWWARAAGRQAP